MNRSEKQLSGGAAKNKAKKQCKNGHRFTKKNTIITKDGRRNCLICKRENSRKNYRYRKKVSERTMLEVRREIGNIKNQIEQIWKMIKLITEKLGRSCI